MGETLQETIRRALPDLLRADPGFRHEILEITRAAYADRDETAARFDRVLAELQRDREAQSRKWEAQSREWEEQNRKWDRQMAANDTLIEELRQTRTRQDQALGAIGARWGIASEHSFREALKAILERSFGVKVFNYSDYDASGMVFGAPDQVEIDVIVKNGEVILCELKSSLSKGDIYLFDRKAAFYAQRHQCTVTRKLAISPMVRPNARAVAERLGIEVHGYAEDAALGD